MTSTQIAEKKNLYRMIRTLPDEDTEKVMNYVAFLKYLQQLDDDEDRRAVAERADEPTVPFDEVKKELGLV